MTDEQYEKWRELTDKMIGDLPFDNEMTHIDGIVDFRDELLMYFKQSSEVVPHDTVVSLQELIDSIGWKWEGTGHYYVTMKNCGKIYCTTDADKRDLFIAQLKARLLTGLSK